MLVIWLKLLTPTVDFKLTKLPYEKRVWIATQTVGRARLHYDLWWYYEGVDTRKNIIEVLRRYNEFFRFDINAHFASTIISLGSVFEPAKHTNVNFNSLIKEASHHGVPDSVVKNATAKMGEMKDVRRGIKILRDKLFAHRDASLAYESVFQNANITPDDIPILADAGLEIGNSLLQHIGAEQQFFFNLALKDVEKLFEDLRFLDDARSARR
jgi:hypothetical protein